jgi:hypothetical protein
LIVTVASFTFPDAVAAGLAFSVCARIREEDINTPANVSTNTLDV